MNRSEKRIFNLQKKILASKRWQQMMEKVDIGVRDKIFPNPRPVKLNKRFKRTIGRAGDVLEVSYDYYKQASYKDLKDTVAHELVHYYLEDNSVSSSHTKYFRRCARFLNLQGYYSLTYKHICGECESWLKSKKKKHVWRCQYCGKMNVTKTEYRKLKKIAELKSRCFSVTLSRYVIMKKVRKID